MKTHKGIVLLVAAIMVMIVLCSLGVAASYQFISGSRSVESEIYAKKAFYLAEAGIERAMWQLDNDSDDDWSNATPSDFNAALGEGSFNVVFSSRAEDSIQIESTGTLQAGGAVTTRTIKVKVAR